MEVPIEAELRTIARAIVAEAKGEADWAAVESDDAFQDGRYVGGHDADESAFCFSYSGSEVELWFQFTLAEAKEIAAGADVRLHGRPAE